MKRSMRTLLVAALAAMTMAASPATTEGPFEDIDNCYDKAMWTLGYLNVSGAIYYCTYHLTHSEDLAWCATYPLSRCDDLLP